LHSGLVAFVANVATVLRLLGGQSVVFHLSETDRAVSGNKWKRISPARTCFDVRHASGQSKSVNVRSLSEGGENPWQRFIVDQRGLIATNFHFDLEREPRRGARGRPVRRRPAGE
jgi:hypothetical protein